MTPPYSYDFLNVYSSTIQPSTVHCRNNSLTAYFRRYLLEKAMSVFKWTAPAKWAMNYFRYVLYVCGYITIVNTNKWGVIPVISGLRGYNVFYQPTHAIITNPLITGILEPEIGKDCTVIKLRPDYAGIMDLVYYYAEQMALAAESAGMNLVNSKLSYAFAANSKAMAEALKKLYDQMQAGNPLVVYDSHYSKEDGQPILELFAQDLRQNFIAPDILLTLKKLENEFASKVGLANVNSEKKERLVTDEVLANREETYVLADGWLESLKNGCKEASSMFGIELDVDWRYSHDERNSITSGIVFD